MWNLGVEYSKILGYNENARILINKQHQSYAKTYNR